MLPCIRRGDALAVPAVDVLADGGAEGVVLVGAVAIQAEVGVLLIAEARSISNRKRSLRSMLCYTVKAF